MVSVGQESRHGLAGCLCLSRGSHDAAIKVLLGLQSPLKAQIGQDLHSDSLWWLLAGSRASWAVGWRLSSVSSSMGCAID